MVAAPQFARSVIVEFEAKLITWSKNNASCLIKTFSYNPFKLAVYWIRFICNTSPNGFGPASPRAFFSTLRQTRDACKLSVHDPTANDDEQRRTAANSGIQALLSQQFLHHTVILESLFPYEQQTANSKKNAITSID